MSLFNVGGHTGKDCLLTWADGVKVADLSGSNPQPFAPKSAALTTAPRDVVVLVLSTLEDNNHSPSEKLK